jgi:hypothetical protein
MPPLEYNRIEENVKEINWHRLVELARSLGTGIRLHEDMRQQSFGDVFTLISRIYFNSPAVYRDDKCLSLPFWKRHAYKDRAYSNAVSEAFRLFCRSEIEKVGIRILIDGFIPPDGVANCLDEPWAVVEMLRRAKGVGIGLFTPAWPVQPDCDARRDHLNN